MTYSGLRFTVAAALCAANPWIQRGTEYSGYTKRLRHFQNRSNFNPSCAFSRLFLFPLLVTLACPAVGPWRRESFAGRTRRRIFLPLRSPLAVFVSSVSSVVKNFRMVPAAKRTEQGLTPLKAAAEPAN